MKKLAVLLPLLIAGCDAQFTMSEDQAVVQRDAEGRKTGVVIYTDATTGCQYVKPLHRDGMTPRLGRDGRQICIASAEIRP